MKKLPHYIVFGLCGWTSRAISAFLRFLTLPFLIHALGVGGYALFAILMSLEVWALQGDLGLGSAFQVALSRAKAEERAEAPLYAAGALLAPLFLLFFSLLLIPFHADLGNFLFGKLSDREGWVVPTALFVYFVQTLTSLGWQALQVEEKGYFLPLTQLISSIFFAGSVFALTFFPEEMRLFVAFFSHAVVLTTASVGVFIFRFLKKSPLPHLSKESIRQLLKSALLFIGQGVLFLVAFAPDVFIISRTLNAHDVVVYFFLFRIFSLAFYAYQMMLWSLRTDCVKRFYMGQGEAVSRLLKKSAFSGMLLMGCGALLFYGLRSFFLPLLLRDAPLIIEGEVILLFGLLFMVRTIAETYVMGLQALSDFGSLYLLYPLQGVMHWICVSQLSSIWGVKGALIGLTLSFLIVSAWLMPLRYYRRLSLRPALQ